MNFNLLIEVRIYLQAERMRLRGLLPWKVIFWNLVSMAPAHHKSEGLQMGENINLKLHNQINIIDINLHWNSWTPL